MPNKRKASDSNQSSCKKAIVSSLEEMFNIVSRCASSVLTSYLQKHPISCAALPLAIVFNQGLKAVQSADKESKTKETIADESNQSSFMFNLPDPIANFTGRTVELEKIHQLLNGESECFGFVIVDDLEKRLGNMRLDNTTSASISGLGGIGKTQLALKYARLYAKDYDNNVIWVDAENLSDSFKRLAGDSRINIKTKDTNGRDKADNSIAQEVYDHFKDKKSLFIFDNVENYEAIKEFLPRQSLDNKPHILITSRYQNWEGIADKISLNVFSDEEARNFVKKELNIVTTEDINKLMSEINIPEDFQLILKKDDIQKEIEKLKGKTNTLDKWLEKLKESLLKSEEQYCTPEPEELVKALKDLLQFLKGDPNITNNDTIEKLNQTLQGLPLALQQAAAYIKQQKIVNPDFGVKDYLEEYNRHYKATEGLLSFNLNRYNNDPCVKTVMTTWQVTLDKIKKDEKSGNEASRILNTMAYLAPDNIPSKTLELVTDREKLAGAIDLLRNYSMISQGNKSDLSNIHRLVQEVMRIGLRKQSAEEEVLGNVLKILKNEIGHIKSNVKNPKINHALLTCVRASRYRQLHQAIENLFLGLNMKEEPTKSLLQCIIDQKRVGVMQYILENMEDQWKQEERQLLVQFLLKGFEDNETKVVNSFKGELQSLMSDPSIFNLLANASLNSVNSMDNVRLAGRITNRSLGLDIKLEKEITITKQFDTKEVEVVIEKGTDILKVREFFFRLKNNEFQYFNYYSGQKTYKFRLSSTTANRELYQKGIEGDIMYLRGKEVVSHIQVSGSSHHERQTIPLMDNYYHNFNYGITPTSLLARYFQAMSYTQVSSSSRFSDPNSEILSSGSRQTPTLECDGSREELENNLSEAMDDGLNPRSTLGNPLVAALHNSKSYSK